MCNQQPLQDHRAKIAMAVAEIVLGVTGAMAEMATANAVTARIARPSPDHKAKSAAHAMSAIARTNNANRELKKLPTRRSPADRKSLRSHKNRVSNNNQRLHLRRARWMPAMRAKDVVGVAVVVAAVAVVTALARVVSRA